MYTLSHCQVNNKHNSRLCKQANSLKFGRHKNTWQERQEPNNSSPSRSVVSLLKERRTHKRERNRTRHIEKKKQSE